MKPTPMPVFNYRKRERHAIVSDPQKTGTGCGGGLNSANPTQAPSNDDGNFGSKAANNTTSSPFNKNNTKLSSHNNDIQHQSSSSSAFRYDGNYSNNNNKSPANESKFPRSVSAVQQSPTSSFPKTPSLISHKPGINNRRNTGTTFSSSNNSNNDNGNENFNNNNDACNNNTRNMNLSTQSNSNINSNSNTNTNNSNSKFQRGNYIFVSPNQSGGNQQQQGMPAHSNTSQLQRGGRVVGSNTSNSSRGRGQAGRGVGLNQNSFGHNNNSNNNTMKMNKNNNNCSSSNSSSGSSVSNYVMDCGNNSNNNNNMIRNHNNNNNNNRGPNHQGRGNHPQQGYNNNSSNSYRNNFESNNANIGNSFEQSRPGGDGFGSGFNDQRSSALLRGRGGSSNSTDYSNGFAAGASNQANANRSTNTVRSQSGNFNSQFGVGKSSGQMNNKARGNSNMFDPPIPFDGNDGSSSNNNNNNNKRPFSAAMQSNSSSIFDQEDVSMHTHKHQKTTTKPVDTSLRIFTCPIGDVQTWCEAAIYHGTVMFEIYGLIVSGPTDTDCGVGKEFYMRDQSATIRCVFYEIDREVPDITRGQVHRVVGSLTKPRNQKGEGNSYLKVVSLRKGEKQERDCCQQATELSLHEMDILSHTLSKEQ